MVSGEVYVVSVVGNDMRLCLCVCVVVRSDTRQG